MYAKAKFLKDFADYILVKVICPYCKTNNKAKCGKPLNYTTHVLNCSCCRVSIFAEVP